MFLKELDSGMELLVAVLSNNIVAL